MKKIKQFLKNKSIFVNLLCIQSKVFLLAAIIGLLTGSDNVWYLLGTSAVLEGLSRIEMALKQD